MAYATDTTDFAALPNGVFARIWHWLSLLGQAAFIARGMEARAEKIRTLQMKSDAELAELGLRRDEIPAYVFRDLMYA